MNGFGKRCKIICSEITWRIKFLWLGVAFFIAGFVCFIGVLRPKASSIIQGQTLLGFIFSMLGVLFIIVQIVFKVIVTYKNKLYSELISSGIKITGKVEKVYMQKYTQYGKQSPYRILYTYTNQGKVYLHKKRITDYGEGRYMPLVRIEIIKGKSADYKKTMLNCVHNGLIDALGIEDWDRFQRIIEIDRADYETSPEKSDRFTIIELTLFPGRSKEQKKAVIESITSKLNEELSIEAKDIFIVIQEPPLENWGMGGKQKE